MLLIFTRQSNRGGANRLFRNKIIITDLFLKIKRILNFILHEFRMKKYVTGFKVNIMLFAISISTKFLEINILVLTIYLTGVYNEYTLRGYESIKD